MATIVPNTFTSWDLSDAEALQGSIFTITQLQVLQNKLSEIAEEKINLEFTPDDAMSFVQQEAYKKGQLELIQYMIDSSEASAEELQSPTPT